MKYFFFALPIFLIHFATISFAQNNSVYNHYYNTPYLINPAELGVNPYMSASINHRQQWRGVEDAPVVTTLTFESPFNYKNWALGVNVKNFNRGLISTTDLLVTYSYSVFLNSRTTFHFGLSAGLTNNNIDFTEIKDPSDPAIANFLDNNLQPISNFGLKIKSESGFNLGISLPRLFEPQYVNSSNFEAFNFSPIDEVTVLAYFKRPIDSKIVTRRKGGYKRRVKIEDTFAPLQIYAMYQYSQIVGQRIELLSTLHLNENVWVGGSYRLNYGASGLFGFTVKDLSISYAYEPASKLVSGFANGSHEIQLSLQIGDKKILARNKPKLKTIDKSETRAPRFSSNEVQLGGGEELADEGKKYYVVVSEYKDFISADRFVKKIKKDLDLNSDIFFNTSNGIYYVYIFETFSRRDANKDKKAAEELTKFKNIKIIIVDLQ